MLFGLALGDAIGWPVEFTELTQIKTIHGPMGIQEPPDPALYTDDTQMTTALTEGLLDAGLNAPLDTQMAAVGKRFIEWRDTAPSRAPGNTCLAGVARIESGMTWREAGIATSKGCGSAMRVATIGYFYRNDEARLYEVARASGMLTHGHPAAVAASIAAAYLVKLALTGAHTHQYIAKTLAFCDGISDEFDAAMLRIGHVLGWVDEEAAMRHIGEGWVGDEAVALALYCVLRYDDDYVACMRRAANSNGDSDSIACIAGGIMGARLGSLAGLPAEWVARCENHDYLMDLARRMAEHG
ncbi:MAG: ADP-ribosylglycohydrolase family protein [Anaerolineae bacterium]